MFPMQQMEESVQSGCLTKWLPRWRLISQKASKTVDLPKSLPPIVDLTLGNICSGESANDLCDSHITQIRYSEENI